MTKNAIKRIIRISNLSLFLSLATLVILSCIDVVPWKQIYAERIFYFFLTVFVVSLIVSCIGIVHKSKQRRRKGAMEP